MFTALPDFRYMPIVKWKSGEYRAFGSLSEAEKLGTIPLFLIPPVGSFDHEEGRVLSAAEHIRSFGPRLFQHCGKHLVFVDASRVDDEHHKKGLSSHPLTVLLERAQWAGAVACPSVELSSSTGYIDAVARFVARDPRLPACLRLTGRDLERAHLASDIRHLLGEIGCPVSRAVLLVDFGPIEVAEAKAFAELLSIRLNTLPFVSEWLGLVVASTAFPEPSKVKIKAGEHRRYARSEWLIYRELFELRDQIVRFPAFGDYATEFPVFRTPGRVAPTAHFRYSTEFEFLIERGTTTKKPYGYGAIYPVADSLAARDEFYGESFCPGDAFIARLAQRKAGHSNAATWRWATTLHHFSVVGKGMRALVGQGPEPAELAKEPVQIEMFGETRQL